MLFPSHKQSSDDEDCSAKGRNRHIIVSKAELSNSIEVLESFKLARESWELLYSLEFLDKGERVLVIDTIYSYKINSKRSLWHLKCQLSELIEAGLGIHSFYRILFFFFFDQEICSINHSSLSSS